jgi:hypothetical protein
VFGGLLNAEARFSSPNVMWATATPSFPLKQLHLEMATNQTIPGLPGVSHEYATLNGRKYRSSFKCFVRKAEL